ncbi:MAG: hypothetical protein HY520_04410 [Candidatus Aenigmarchaeota archaeon]|nr:hypothetical protein [Candidatus Aenigmarchaeota archaeon]
MPVSLPFREPEWWWDEWAVKEREEAERTYGKPPPPPHYLSPAQEGLRDELFFLVRSPPAEVSRRRPRILEAVDRELGLWGERVDGVLRDQYIPFLRDVREAVGQDSFYHAVWKLTYALLHNPTKYPDRVARIIPLSPPQERERP